MGNFNLKKRHAALHVNIKFTFLKDKMKQIICIHEYVLKSGVTGKDFEQAIKTAETEGLFNLPGLDNHYFLKGFKGKRRGHYAAVWIYRDKQVWEKLWGMADNPVGKENYPENWKRWENDILVRFIEGDPDKISYTSYEVIE